MFTRARPFLLTAGLAAGVLAAALPACTGDPGDPGAPGDPGDPGATVTVSPAVMTISVGDTATLTAQSSLPGAFLRFIGVA